jgi:hypothetical protein
MPAPLTSHQVGYTERDLLLSKPEELLGREVRDTATGFDYIVVDVAVVGDEIVTLDVKSVDSGLVFSGKPEHFTLVTA